MTRAIIFDLYGVLALNGWQSFKARYFTTRPELWAEVFELGRQVDAGLADYDDFVRFVAEKTGENEATVRYQLEHTVANDELLAYIAAELKGRYKLGILSNASRDSVLDIFNSKQRELFDAVVFSHHVGLTKPHRDMYHTTADRLGVEPAECVFVDDQERHATGARDAGMQAVVYVGTEALKQELRELA